MAEPSSSRAGGVGAELLPVREADAAAGREKGEQGRRRARTGGDHLEDAVRNPVPDLRPEADVGRVEGRPATALEWAELLMARMQ